MLISFRHHNKVYQADLSKPIDISISLKFNSLENPNAWYCPMPEANAQRFGETEISVSKGMSVNSYGLKFFPHGNGTHTEGVGHLTMDGGEWITVNKILKEFHSLARLISIFPIKQANSDRLILKEQIEDAFENFTENPFNALVIRTLPNDDTKKTRHWSGTNPPYFDPEALAFLAKNNIQHLLTDLPSVDKEDDGGKVAAHRAFWQIDGNNTEGVREYTTITEMIYVPNDIKDDLYLLNLQIPSFEIDAAPSKPVLYKLSEK